MRPRPLLPRTLDQALQLGKAVVAARLAPRGMETPEACMIAIIHGMEVGLSPMQALQRIAVVNGRATIWGDGALALVQASGLARSIQERLDGNKPDDWVGVCEVLRWGSLQPLIRTFSTDDAKRAGLWGKAGPWRDYPRRMLQMRARAFALRDGFADVLGGLYLREEMEETWEEVISDQGGPLPAPGAAPTSTIEARGAPHTEAASARSASVTREAVEPSQARSYPSRPTARAARQKAPPPPADSPDTSMQDHPAIPTGAHDVATASAPADDPAEDTDGAYAGQENAVLGSPAELDPEQKAAGDGSPKLPTLTANGLARAQRRRRSEPRTALSLRYAHHWAIRRPRAMPPEPAYRRRSGRVSLPASMQSGASHDEPTSPDHTVESPADTLVLYDDALSCAFDQATLDEIVEEFLERLDGLPGEDSRKAEAILRTHEARVASLASQATSNGCSHE